MLRSSNENEKSNSSSGIPLKEVWSACSECLDKRDYIQALKEALRDTLEQNTSLQKRSVELEALLTEQHQKNLFYKKKLLRSIKRCRAKCN